MEVRIKVKPSGYWSIAVPTRSWNLLVITGRALTARFVTVVVRLLDEVQSIDAILNTYERTDNMRSLRRSVLGPLFGELVYEGKHIFVGFGPMEDVCIVPAPKSFVKCASLPLRCSYSSIVIPSHVMQAVVAKANSVGSHMQTRVLSLYLGIYQTFADPRMYKCVIEFHSLNFMFLFVLHRHAKDSRIVAGVPLGVTDDFQIVVQSNNKVRHAIVCLALSVLQRVSAVNGNVCSIQISPERIGNLRNVLYAVLPLLETCIFLETHSVEFNHIQNELIAKRRQLPDKPPPAPLELRVSAKEFLIKSQQFPDLQELSQQISRLDLDLRVRVLYARMLSSLIPASRRQSLREMMFKLLLKLLSPEFSRRVDWKEMMAKSVYREPFRFVVVVDGRDTVVSWIPDTDYFTIGDSPKKLTGEEVLRQVPSEPDPPLPDGDFMMFYDQPDVM